MSTKEKIAEEAVEVIEHAIDHASKKDVGFFLKAIAVAIVIIAIGYAISLMFEGKREVSFTGKTGRSITISKE